MTEGPKIKNDQNELKNWNPLILNRQDTLTLGSLGSLNFKF
jgi:hypothetical protein